MNAKTYIKISDILKNELERLKKAKGSSHGESHLGGWQSIVGEALAKHSQIIDIKNGEARIETSHAACFQLILLKKESILKELQRHYAGLKIYDLNVSIKKSSKD